MVIYDFKDFDTKVLKKALKLYEELKDIGFGEDEDMIREIKIELNTR